MKAARLTAASVHHFLDAEEPMDPSRPVDFTGSADAVLADTAIVLSPVYSCTSYLYAVLIRCTRT
jgi:hypothetical protein